MVSMEQNNSHEAALRRWFDAWLTADEAAAAPLCAQDAVYSECWGPQYRGRAQILRWFADWNRDGRVLEWRIRRLWQQGDTVIAEWFFRCVKGCERAAFDGVTIAEFDAAGRIAALREFESKAEHVFPYGEDADPA